jgi:hypothetical protein
MFHREKQRLIGIAMAKYGRILPCADRKSLESCFTMYGNQLIFWYNTPDHSTHIEVVRIAYDR